MDPTIQHRRIPAPARQDVGRATGLDAVARARALVRRTARRSGLGPDRTDDLVVATSEAFTNALEAQLAAGVTDPVEVTCRLDHGVFEVRVSDRGDGFDPSSLRPRPPHSDPAHLDLERGWGITIMRRLVDDVVFDVTGRGTVVCLRVRT
jgi:serine/threonine-protein kinase RsbW